MLMFRCDDCGRPLRLTRETTVACDQCGWPHHTEDLIGCELSEDEFAAEVAGFEENERSDAEIEALCERLAQEALARAGVETFRELRHLWWMNDLGLDVKDRPHEITMFEETFEDGNVMAGLLNPWFLLGDPDDDPEARVQSEYEHWKTQLFEAYLEEEEREWHEEKMATDPAYRADYEAQEARREAASTARALANPEPESDVPF